VGLPTGEIGATLAGSHSPLLQGTTGAQSDPTRERSFMIGNSNTGFDSEIFLDTFAAELTNAAYPVALRHAKGDSWVDLELDLWRVLAATVERWGRDARRLVPK
jgi:hypothetical protein